jgi:hypothetical protein
MFYLFFEKRPAKELMQNILHFIRFKIFSGLYFYKKKA